MNPTAAMAERLGMTRDRGRWGPCQVPTCQVSRLRDGRAPVRINDNGWWCNACGTRGNDGIDLVSYRLLGRPGKEALADFPRVLAWIEGRGAAAPLEGNRQQEPEREAKPPPSREVAALFNRSKRAHEDPQVAEYLRSRGIRPSLAPAWAVPEDFGAEWWPHPWSKTWRLLVPAWGPQGQVRTLHARAVVQTTEGKTRWPRGCSAGATVFADQIGRRALRGDWSGIRRIMVVEGLTDFISTSAAILNEGREGTGTWAVESGSESCLKLVRTIPDVRFLIGTHDDVDGDRYALKAIDALAPRPCIRVPLGLLARRVP